MARSYTNPAPGPIGSTFSAAAGQANNKLYVAANGQTLNKADYPELAGAYNDQSQEFVGNFVDIQTAGQLPISSVTQRMCFDQTSTYAIYCQDFSWASSQNGFCLWKTTNGIDWSLLYLLIDGGTLRKVVAIGNDIFICRSSGLYRVASGTTVTKPLFGLISDICSNGTTYLIVNETSTGFSTTDFLTFSSVSFPATTRGCVFFNTRYWIFTNTTTVRYSTDLITWTSSPITLPAASQTNFQKVVNGQIFSFNQTGGQPIFRYNSDPLVNAWSSSGTNYGSHGPVTGMIYDSGTSQYIMPITFNSTGGPFAFVFSNIAAAGTQVRSSTIPGANIDTCATLFGSNRYYQVGPQYGVGSTTWLTLDQDLNQTTSIQNPFFMNSSLGTLSSRGGVTHLGNRWLSKAMGDTGLGTCCLGLMVEIGGVFKEIRNSSAVPSAIQTGSSVPTWTVLYEDASGYAFTAGFATSNYYYGTVGTNRAVINSGSIGTPTASQSQFVPVKGVGIHIFETNSNTTRTIYNLPSTSLSAPSTLFSYTLATTSEIKNYQIIETTGELIITELNATPTTSPTFYVLKNGGLTGQFGITLFNTSGSTVSVASTAKVFKLEGTYYCHNNGILYSSQSGTTFNQVGNSVSLTSSGITALTQNENGVLLGNYKVLNNFGTITVTNPTSGSNSQSFAYPLFFPIDGSLAFGSYMSSSAMNGYRYSSSVDTTTQFLIPSIASTTSGQGVYIVAR